MQIKMGMNINWIIIIRSLNGWMNEWISSIIDRFHRGSRPSSSSATLEDCKSLNRKTYTNYIICSIIIDVIFNEVILHTNVHQEDFHFLSSMVSTCAACSLRLVLNGELWLLSRRDDCNKEVLLTRSITNYKSTENT